MIPKIHKKGSSVISCARYALHDKGKDTDERVEFAETYNLATHNPHIAAKVMAATAMDSARLKKEAGIPNTGRKSNQHVLHATLSWHADEAAELTREHKLSAAKWFLEKLGASDRQAIIVSHRDEPQPHVHLIINRVSPTDGRMLSSSLEKIKASEWAQKYEQDRGKIYCHNRVINNEARERGDYVRGEKDEARHFHEMKQQAGKDQALQQTVAKETERIKRLYRQQKEAERQAKAKNDAMVKEYRDKIKQLRDGMQQTLTIARQNVRERFRDEWIEDHYECQAQLAKFELQEKGFLGRVKNALSAVDWSTVMNEDHGHPNMGRVGKLGDAFKALGDAGARLEMLKRQQVLHQHDIQRRQNLAEASAVAETRRRQVDRMRAVHAELMQQREQHDLHAKRVQEALENKVRATNRQRRQAWEQQLEQKRLRGLKAVPQDRFSGDPLPANDNRPTETKTAASGGSGASPTRSSDLLPPEDAARRAKQIDTFKERLREANDNQRDRDNRKR